MNQKMKNYECIYCVHIVCKASVLEKFGLSISIERQVCNEEDKFMAEDPQLFIALFSRFWQR
jgi:hypothetical protein